MLVIWESLLHAVWARLLTVTYSCTQTNLDVWRDLVTLDIRRDSGDTEAVAEIADELGDYLGWDETKRCDFLKHELSNPRPLILTNLSRQITSPKSSIHLK